MLLNEFVDLLFNVILLWKMLNATNDLHLLNVAGVIEEYCINQFCLLEGVSPFYGD